MKFNFTKSTAVFVLGLLVFSCNNNDGDTTTNTVTKYDVMVTYADIAHANYKQAYDDAVLLETAINTFVATPTEANFTAAKTAWKVSRESYGTTEGFRFANGPIDGDDDAPEGLINSWPLDENFIDYVDGNSNAGIINDVVNFPTLDKDVLEQENGQGANEANVSVGYHAIEFLLWGQDLTAPSENKPGQRLYTDYVVPPTASKLAQVVPVSTVLNQERRGVYLKVCADLLTDHLLYLVNEWKEGGAYRAEFLALNQDVAIKNIYLGITTLSGAELPVERMDVALLSESQEDEHSCFSDNTHRDIVLNLQSVINIYNGTYGTINGASLADLVKQANVSTYNLTKTAEKSAIDKVDAIITPFDLAISGGLNSTEGAKVRSADVQIREYSANLLAGASKIGITVN